MRCVYLACEMWELEYNVIFEYLLQYRPKPHSLIYNFFQLIEFEFEFEFKLDIYTNL